MELVDDLFVSDPLFNTIDEMAKAIAKEKDKIILEAFARYGYDENWIRKNYHRVIVTRVTLRTLTAAEHAYEDTYSIDGEDTFAIYYREVNTADESKEDHYSIGIDLYYGIVNMKEVPNDIRD